MGVQLAMRVELPAAPLSTTGADLRGWSVLPLLGQQGSSLAPWLFLSDRSVGWLTAGPPAQGRFVRTVADYEREWPFSEGALGGAVIDGEALVQQLGEAGLRRLLVEASRAVGKRDVLVVCGHRLLPRRVRAWREYGRASVDRWQHAASELGLDSAAAAGVRFDGDRVTEVMLPTVGRGAIKAADRLVMRVSSPGRTSATALEGIVAAASAGADSALHVECVAVRKIGKTVLRVAAGDGRRFMLRVARSPISLARARRNFDALEWLHHSAVPIEIRRQAPQPLAQGRVGGYEYFLETALDGRAGGGGKGHGCDAWPRDAASYISALHAATRQRVTVEESTLAELVRGPIEHVARLVDRASADVLRRVGAISEAQLAGQALPLVRVHGDFTGSNCLFDDKGRFSGVVDWEVSCPRGLPLLDLLQLMPVAGDSGAHPRWRRFDAWLELWREPQRVLCDPVMGAYVRELGIPEDCIPALVLMQWVTHIAERVEARCDDQRWMRLRVGQPVESLAKVLA